MTRFARRLRIGGTAELCGFDLSRPARRRATLEKVLADLFPQGGDAGRGEFWTGLRPATPDGTPVVGATRLRNLYLNTGHGTLGWTMACGSGCYLADLMAGVAPQISTEGLDVFRYQHRRRGPAEAVGFEADGTRVTLALDQSIPSSFRVRPAMKLQAAPE